MKGTKHMKRYKLLPLIISLTLVVLFLSACGASTGKVEGIVTSSAKGRIANAKVVLESKNGDPNLVQETRTDAEGRFAFEEVAPGDYYIKLMEEVNLGQCTVTNFAEAIEVKAGERTTKAIELKCF